ncbi:MAG: hypothetical protein ACYDBB_18770 [Armatimonadota bacterium]
MGYVRWMCCLLGLGLLLGRTFAAERLSVPEITFQAGEAWQCSVVPVTPVIRSSVPIILLDISLNSNTREAEPPFYSWLHRSHQYVEHRQESPDKMKPALAIVQSLGEHLYAPVLAPNTAWNGGTALAFPVGGEASKTVTLWVSYAVPTKEQLAAHAVIFTPDKPHLAVDDAEVTRALAGATPVSYYLGTGPYWGMNALPGNKDLVSFTHRYTLTVPVKPRPVPAGFSFSEVEKREARAPEWYFAGAWVLRGDDESAILLRKDSRKTWSSVDPAFFTAISPDFTTDQLRMAVDQAQFRQRFPTADVSADQGGSHMRFSRKIKLTDLLAWSRQFDGTEYTLSGINRSPYIVSAPAKLPIDLAVVAQKIAGLGLRDDSLPERERPQSWLFLRRKRIVPQLIAGLDNPTLRIAEECLRLLRDVPRRPKLVDALVRIAGNTAHPLSRQTLLALPRYLDDPRVRPLIAANYADEQRLPKADDRATLALAIGKVSEAVAILAQQLAAALAQNLNAGEVIRRLAATRHPSAIPPLEELVKSSRWNMVSAAYLALAELDPRDHALTDDQRQFLEEAGREGKLSREYQQRRMERLASLDREQIRPYVLKMLRCGNGEEAAGILCQWGDRDALPEIRRILLHLERYRIGPMLAAYLPLAEEQEAVTTVRQLVEPDDQSKGESIAEGIITSRLPDERKVSLLRTLRANLHGQANQAIGKGLSRAGYAGVDIVPLLGPLMAEERDLGMLGWYAALAARDTKLRLEKEVKRAVVLLAEHPVPQNENPAEAYPTRRILDAAAAYRLTGIDKELPPFFTSPARLAAANAALYSKTLRSEGLAILAAGLREEKAWTRKQASEYLRDAKPANEEERAARETLLLAHLGKPTEDYALRLLATCGGEQTIRALEPLLDGENCPRAIYVAWVLAHLPDRRISEKALRRLAINAMLHPYISQQGGGFGFSIAPNLEMGQETCNLNRAPLPPTGPDALVLPSVLLEHLQLDATEQAFAIRAYRLSVSVPAENGWNLTFLADFYSLPNGPNASYLPLLQVVALEDPYLDVLHVKGAKVAHFPLRKKAAESIAGLTGKKATYRGLQGEELDSAQLPAGPYPEQNRLIAAYLLDRIQAAKLVPPNSREDEGPVNGFNNLLQRLCGVEQFGPELKTAIQDEAERRGISAWLEQVGVLF